ncbi:hypothetical protein DS079_16735, partial [Brachybacterium paraconglomeratum]
GHVEVFQMASVRTSIIGRPRRLSRHRRAHPVTRTYTLRCEEPPIDRGRRRPRTGPGPHGRRLGPPGLPGVSA